MADTGRDPAPPPGQWSLSPGGSPSSRRDEPLTPIIVPEEEQETPPETPPAPERPDPSKWKLIIGRLRGPGLELFDLSSDVGETKNLVQQQPALVDKLKRLFVDWMNLMAERNGESTPNWRLSTMQRAFSR